MSVSPVKIVSNEEERYIMIVDDDQTLLKFFKIHLNKYYAKVIVVKSAKDAIETLKDENRKVDIVISDIRMPRTDGIQLLKKIKNINASVPVMLVSGALLSEEQEDHIAEKADGFLKKPFSIEDLHALIEAGMKKREKLIALSKMVDTNKKLRDILAGKASLKRSVSEPNFEEATELFEHLKAS